MNNVWIGLDARIRLILFLVALALFTILTVALVAAIHPGVAQHVLASGPDMISRH